MNKVGGVSGEGGVLFCAGDGVSRVRGVGRCVWRRERDVVTKPVGEVASGGCIHALLYTLTQRNEVLCLFR